MTDYTTELLDRYYAVERGLVDEVIDLRETRRWLIDGLAMLRAKTGDLGGRKHGNPPL